MFRLTIVLAFGAFIVGGGVWQAWQVEPNLDLISPEAIVADLIDPVQLDQLRGRHRVKRRLLEACHWIHAALKDDVHPELVVQNAQLRNSRHTTDRTMADRNALLRAYEALENFGCRGNSLPLFNRGYRPVIQRGEHHGEYLAIDHIIPPSICPELKNRFYNLELVPESKSRKRSDKIGRREVQLANKWFDKNLLSDDGRKQVLRAHGED